MAKQKYTTRTRGTRKGRKQYTCYCDAYPFPHRLDGGLCTGVSSDEEDDWYDERTEALSAVERNPGLCGYRAL